ncbi:thiamine pyrophosphate-dependent enzyme [Scopulibacillus daqui]|uniref:thiamine pyrophosphate-dependent enzyme n=1 Tax=Scopulibacillus daqui TaxID=1469162 RepID=UPI00363BBB0F
MFRKKAGEVLIDLLIQWGVDHIYGMPGDSINSIVEPLRKAHEAGKIKFIQVRHEEAGALAAAAYAKLTGKLGVCLTIAGPGSIHTLNGLYDAKLDRAPVLAICGQVESDLLGTDFFQEVNLERLFDDVAVYNQRIMSAEQLPTVVNQAIRTAYTRHGVAVLTVPDDVPKFEMEGDIRYTKPFYVKPQIMPELKDLEQAKQVINDAEKPVILAGKGTKGASQALIDFAEKIAAPIVLSLPAKGVIPDEHPLCLGGLGQIGTKPAYNAMQNADTLILIGTSYPFNAFLPDKAKTIHVDIDPYQIGKRYPADVGCAGDAGKTLEWLTAHIKAKQDRSFLEHHQEMMKRWWKKMEQEEADDSVPIKPQKVLRMLNQVAHDDAVLSVDVGCAGDAGKTLEWLTAHIKAKQDRSFLEHHQEMMKRWWKKMEQEEADDSVPIKPQKVLRMLNQVAHDDAVLSVDVGNVTVWTARDFRITNQQFILSSWLATLGCGLPGALAGQMAYPDKQVFAICGDGGFGMTMNDFVTAVKYELPIKIIVLNNHKIAMIKYEQEVMGNIEFGTNLVNPNFAKFAEACGGIGYRVEKVEELPQALEQAVSQTKPCIVDVIVDANEPPLPAKITFAQAAGFSKHMVKELFTEGKLDLPPI